MHLIVESNQSFLLYSLPDISSSQIQVFFLNDAKVLPGRFDQQFYMANVSMTIGSPICT